MGKVEEGRGGRRWYRKGKGRRKAMGGKQLERRGD